MISKLLFLQRNTCVYRFHSFFYVCAHTRIIFGPSFGLFKDEFSRDELEVVLKPKRATLSFGATLRFTGATLKNDQAFIICWQSTFIFICQQMLDRDSLVSSFGSTARSFLFFCSVPGGKIPRVETNERECWEFLDWQLASENDSLVPGQPSFLKELLFSG